MLRLILAAFLAAVVLMVWGFLFWTVLPFSKMMIEPVGSAEEDLAAALQRALPHTGVYLLPHADCDTMQGGEADALEALAVKHRAGPIAHIFYRKEGLEPMDPMLFVFGFVHFLVSALVAGLLLQLALPNRSSYCARVLFVFLLGVFAAVALNLSTPIWFHHPWKYALLHSGFDITGWLLAGLVLAGLIRPE